MDPARRELFTDWARSSRLAVAKFRADSVSHLGDPAFEELIAALQRPSPDFCKACKRHEVARTVSGRKELRHPEVGTMVFEHALFNPADAPEPRPADAPEQRLILYTPLPEHDTPAKLERLLGR